MGIRWRAEGRGLVGCGADISMEGERLGRWKCGTYSGGSKNEAGTLAKMNVSLPGLQYAAAGSVSGVTGRGLIDPGSFERGDPLTSAGKISGMVTAVGARVAGVDCQGEVGDEGCANDIHDCEV